MNDPRPGYLLNMGILAEVAMAALINAQIETEQLRQDLLRIQIEKAKHSDSLTIHDIPVEVVTDHGEAMAHDVADAERVEERTMNPAAD